VKKVACDCEIKESDFGSELFCKSCGMNIEFNGIKKRVNKKEEYFCCEGCISQEKEEEKSININILESY
jgi:hypothetical protein